MSGQVTGKAADARPQAGVQSATGATAAALSASNSGYTKEKKAASQAENRETLATTFGLAGSGNSTTRNTSSTVGVQLPTVQTGTQSTGTSTTGRISTGLAADAGLQTGVQRTTVVPTTTFGKAADSGIARDIRRTQQQMNRQTVQNWWNNEHEKTAQDNSTNRAYTAKLTGGANIDNSADVLKNIQRTFGGANDSAKTQYDRTLQSKLGYGQNWDSPQSAVGNAIESGVAGTVAGWLNAAGTALKSNQRSGLAVDSGNSRSAAGGG